MQYGLARTPGTAWFLKPGERHWLQQRQDAAAAAAAAKTGSGAGQLVGAPIWAVGLGAVRMRPERLHGSWLYCSLGIWPNHRLGISLTSGLHPLTCSAQIEVSFFTICDNLRNSCCVVGSRLQQRRNILRAGGLTSWRLWYLSAAWFMISCSSMGVLFWVPLLLKAMLAGDFGGHAGAAHGAPPPAPAHTHGPDREQVGTLEW